MSSNPPPRIFIKRRAAAPLPGLARALRQQGHTLQSIPEQGAISSSQRRPSSSANAKKLTTIGIGPKAQRTSKTSQKLVVLPSEIQTRPLPESVAPLADDIEARPLPVPDHRSQGERMAKSERERAGYPRLTAYCTAEGYRMKLLAAFLKREHGVAPRAFDEALYAVYHLPLLPGYGPHVNVRSSAPAKTPGTKSIFSKMSEAEEYGYDGSYFTSSPPQSPTNFLRDGFIRSSPDTRRAPVVPFRDEENGAESQTENETETETETEMETDRDTVRPAPSFVPPEPVEPEPPQRVAELVMFDYGVAVFLGFEETQERAILEDCERAMTWIRKRTEENWEIERCHFVYDPSITYPRIYNDFFTFKTPSHLLTLSLSHALAQSTLLAHYESNSQSVLSSPQTLSIPRQLSATGSLKLRRKDALKLTGSLFKLRRDVNLVSNVLETPELFWSEASLKDLYDACRDYFEIGERAKVLNEKLSVASDLLDIIHEHLNNGAMHRITWIIIWLIVVACLVELGEVIARLVVHESRSSVRGTAIRALGRKILNLGSK